MKSIVPVYSIKIDVYHHFSALNFIVEVNFWSELKTVVSCDLFIRVCGSTLYVGLQHAVPPTNTKFKPLLLPTLMGIPYTNTHKHRTSYFKSTLTFLGPAKRWNSISAARQKLEILTVLHQQCLYVGLAHTVPPTNTNFRFTFLLIRLQETLYEDLSVQSIKFEIYHHFSCLCFIAEVNFWHSPKTVISCDKFIIIIIIIIFFRRVFSRYTEAFAASLIPPVTNFPEICAFIIGFSFTV